MAISRQVIAWLSSIARIAMAVAGAVLTVALEQAALSEWGHDMPNAREIREQVISQLVNVYANTPDLGDEAEPLPLFDLDQPGWTGAELAQVYAEAMAMFIYYAREVESQGGPGFLEHLQRQALLDATDDDPSASS